MWRVILVAIAAWCVVGSRPALADNALVSSTPPDGATLPSSPKTFQLLFRDQLGVVAQVALSCDGTVIPTNAPQIGEDLKSVVFTITQDLAPGSSCTVTYRVSNPDGTLGADGRIGFRMAGAAQTTTTSTLPGTTTTGTIAPIDAGTATATGGASAPSGGLNGLLALSRLIANIGLGALFGALVLIVLAWPEGVDYVLTVRFLRAATALGILGSLLTVVILAGRTHGGGLTDGLSPGGWTDLTDLTGGTAALLRLLLAVGCVWVVARPDRINDPTQQTPSLAIPGLAVLTLAFTRGTAPGLVGVLAAMVHVLSMSVWFGGLALLARVVLTGPGEEDLVHAVRGYQRFSLLAILLTVMSGLAITYELDWHHLLGTGHGKVAILKILAVGGLIFLGLASREFVRSRLTRVDSLSTPMAARLQRAVSAEAMVAVLVLALTAWLTSLAPGGLTKSVAAANEDQLGPPHALASSAQEVAATVRLSEQVGPNAVLVEITKPKSGLQNVVVKFTPPAGSDGNAVELHVPLHGAGRALLPKSANLPLNVPGVWGIILTINNTRIDSTNVNIQPATDLSPTPGATAPAGTAPPGGTGG